MANIGQALIEIGWGTAPGSATWAGCNDYDVKPIELPRLLEKMVGLGIE